MLYIITSFVIITITSFVGRKFPFNKHPDPAATWIYPYKICFVNTETYSELADLDLTGRKS